MCVLAVAVVVIPGVMWYGYHYGSSRNPIGMAVFPMALAGSAAGFVSLLYAWIRNRRITCCDGLRIIAWVLVGTGLGWGECIGAYYTGYYPQNGRVVARVALSLFACGISLWVSASLWMFICRLVRRGDEQIEEKGTSR